MSELGTLAVLPAEILRQVTILLGDDDLKNMRLVHRFYTPAATSALFSTIHVSPNMLSYERAMSIARCGDLAKHVRELRYHTARLDAGRTRPYVAGTPLGERYPRWHVLDHARRTGRTSDELFKCFRQEVRAYYDFLFLGEVELLKRLTSHFSSLKAIGTVREEENSFPPPSNHIERRTGGQVIDSIVVDHFVSLVKATLNVSFTKLRADMRMWYDLTAFDNLPGAAERFGRVRELHLRLDYPEILHDEQDNVKKSFKNFLRKFTNLEALALDFGLWARFGQTRNPLLLTQAPLYEKTFPRLSRLEVCGLVSYEEPFIQFLKSHANTLEDLTISSFIIRQKPNGPRSWAHPHSSTASILSLFSRIHDVCRLNRARINAYFTNLHDEFWMVKPGARGGLVSDIERFLCRRGHWPFQDLSRYLGVQKTHMETMVAYRRLGDFSILPPLPPAMAFCDAYWIWHDPRVG
ncbi:hypothetical protein RBB50_000926 [Rhinocladiella similis]